MRHRGHPTSTIEVSSGLLGYCIVVVELSGSEDTHELSRDISHDETDVLGEPTCWLGAALGGGGDNFSVNSSFGLFALRLIAFYVFQLFDN